MRILELTNYSAGICGVWNRVKEESKLLIKKGHTVKVFSSVFVKGSNEEALASEVVEGIPVQRFKALKLGGESFMYWYNREVEKEVMAFKPEVIIAHCYRHHHTTAALRTARRLGIKVYLVTHAPFVDNNETRSLFAKFSVVVYDRVVGPLTLPKFDKIISITKWENPYLFELGVPQSKIVCIPNGIPNQFFTKPNKGDPKKILFLGRISPIKNLEVLIDALLLLKETAHLEIVGPAEQDYLKKIRALVKKNKLEKKISFSGPIYTLPEKIRKIDSCTLFILPSKREAMPQALIEAMARARVCIASANKGTKEIIKSGSHGYLFKNGDAQSLAEKVDFCLSHDQSAVKNAAQKKAASFKWSIMIERLEQIICPRNKNN